ncbi:MAG: PH domain-containing protein [Deltaproteobacteria bacterium]|nr:PH domain-containing protein [Deltaproteobacteria bacterium]
MTTDSIIPKQFEAVKDSDEEIFWVGKPNFAAFLTRGIPFLCIGLIWGAIDYFAFIRNMPAEMAGFAIPFFALHLMPFWASILNFVRLFLVHGNTFYAFSNRRLMMRSGFWGTDFKAIDYDRISDIEVNVNPIENMLKVGTIQAFSGRVSDKGGRIYDKFIGIQDPYEVFKRIKEVTVNIKTDWNYPNAMRPETNPGYKTKYEKEGSTQKML